MEAEQGFDQWCIVELFGHNVIAGRVTEQAVGGETFIRVDVPAVDGADGYTKLFGKGAIYSITPTDEATARLAVATYRKEPVQTWAFRGAGGRQLEAGDRDDWDD